MRTMTVFEVGIRPVSRPRLLNAAIILSLRAGGSLSIT
jgi:hypothetical protein